MSDYRGPIAGPGDEPADVVPRTGPPTGSIVIPQAEPATDSEVTLEPPKTPTEGAAEVVEMPAEEVLEATVREPAAEPGLPAPETSSAAPQSSEATGSLELQLPPLHAEETARPENEAVPAVEHADETPSDQQRTEVSEDPQALVRDVLAIDPTVVVPEPIAALAAPATIPEIEGSLPAAACEAEQRAELPAPEADALPIESLAAHTVFEHPAEPAAETLAEAETATEITEPPPPTPTSPPLSEEPPTALAPEPEAAVELVAEAPPLTPPPSSPQGFPHATVASPALIGALSEPKLVPQAEFATATAAAPDILAPPEPSPAAAPQSRSAWPGRLKRAVLLIAGLAAGYVVLVLALIVAYRWIDPPRSALMLANHLTGQPVLYAPVPITRISSNLQRAVVTSEDARFCYHRGVDWPALYEAMGESRGGSTITMQTAKNLFLWSSRSYIRKAIEIPVAMTIDAFWPKRRILEVYLNIAEWGPGIFGAEAAAHYHFDKPASRLTAHEATLLAASLPNPIARDAGEPGRITAILASRLRARLGNSDAFVRCLGLRTMRPAPVQTPRKEPKAPQKAAPKAAGTKAEPQIPPWRTTTDPAFNPWQN